MALIDMIDMIDNTKSAHWHQSIPIHDQALDSP